MLDTIITKIEEINNEYPSFEAFYQNYVVDMDSKILEKELRDSRAMLQGDVYKSSSKIVKYTNKIIKQLTKLIERR